MNLSVQIYRHLGIKGAYLPRYGVADMTLSYKVTICTLCVTLWHTYNASLVDHVDRGLNVRKIRANLILLSYIHKKIFLMILYHMPF